MFSHRLRITIVGSAPKVRPFVSKATYWVVGVVAGACPLSFQLFAVLRRRCDGEESSSLARLFRASRQGEATGVLLSGHDPKLSCRSAVLVVTFKVGSELDDTWSVRAGITVGFRYARC